MNEMEEQLSRLFHASVGEPPRQVTFGAVRRQARRRRIAAAVAVTAVLAIAGSVGAAVAANAVRPAPAAKARHVTPPRFYFQVAVGPSSTARVQGYLRSTATGKAEATVRCPGADPYLSSAAASSNQTFFMSCRTSVARGGTEVQVGSRIYRFRVTNSGKVTGFGLLRGGNLRGIRAADMTSSADGNLLAVATASAKVGRISQILVFNTKTGAHATWQSVVLPHGLRFTAYDLSITADGQTLGAFGFSRCVKSDPACKSPGFNMLVVRHATKGGRFEASARMVFSQDQLAPTRETSVQTADISPDGSTVIVVTRGPHTRISQNSITTGNPLRTLYRIPQDAFVGRLRIDPGTGLMLVTGLEQPRSRTARIRELNGWISHGKLMPEQSPQGFLIEEVW